MDDLENKPVLYTEDDFKDPIVETTAAQSYPVLDSLIRSSQGSVIDTPAGTTFEKRADDAWMKLAPELHSIDETIANNAAKNGNIPLVQEAYAEMSKRAKLYNEGASKSYQETFDKVRDIAGKSVDMFVANDYILRNNDVDSIASNKEKISEKMAALAVAEREIRDALAVSTTNRVSSLAHEIAPVLGPFQGAAMQRIVLQNPEFGITKDDVGLMTTRNELYTKLQNKFKTLAPEDKAPWIANLIRAWSDSIFTNKVAMSEAISAILTGEDLEIGGVSDQLNRLGVAFIPVQGAFAGVKIAAKLQKATSLTTAARTLAEAGGKGMLQSAEAAQVAQTLATKERMAAAGIAIKEASGIQDVIDITKLVTLSAMKVLPDAVTTSIKGSTDLIRDKVDLLKTELRNTVAIEGNADLQSELAAIQKTYSTASNPYVHSADFTIATDGLSVGGTVHYKPKDAPAFYTKAAAEEAASVFYQGRKVQVVPDTTNNGFLVEESVVQELKLKRDAKLALYAEKLMESSASVDNWESRIDSLITEFGYNLKTGDKSMASGSAGMRTITIADMDEAAFMSKHGNSKADVKAHEFAHNWWNGGNGLPNPKSPSFKPLFKELRTASKQFRPYVWENHVKHANKTEELLADGMAFWIKHPDKRASMPELSKYLEDSGVAARLSAPTMKSSASGAVATKSIISDEVAQSLFANTSGALIRTENLLHTPTTDFAIVNFANKLAKPLGMEKHPIMVVQFSELQTLAKTNPEFKSVVDNWVAAGPTKEALHTSTKYGSIIVLTSPKVNTASKQQYGLELFAHEYAHAFVYQHILTHGDVFKSLHNSWVRASGLKYAAQNGGVLNVTEALPLEAMFEYRNITKGDQLLLNEWVNKYFKGDKDAYLKHEKEMHSWLNSWEEFFAENFAKWALTDEIPTTILGQAFAKIVENIRRIAAHVADSISYLSGKPALIGANPKVAEFMNVHVKKVQDGVIQSRELTGYAAKNSGAIAPDADALASSIEDLEDEIRAIEAAKGGLVHGWLIKEDVTSKILFDKSKPYTSADINSTVTSALGKLDWNLGTSKEQYESRLVGTHTGSRYTKLLTDFVREPVEKLSQQERVLLDALLIKGDKEGRIFTNTDLLGENASKNVREAYQAVRTIRDITWSMRDNTLTRIYTRKGFMELQVNPALLPASSDLVLGKVVAQAPTEFVYNLSAGKLARSDAVISTPAITFELAQPLDIAGRKYTHIALDSTDFKQVEITSVLPYRTGEYSRNYSDEYFVKINGGHNIDGKVTEQLMTHRTAKTKRQGDAYVKAFNTAVKEFNAGTLSAQRATEIMQPYGWKGEEFLDNLRTGAFGENPEAKVLYNRTDGDYYGDTTGLGGLMGKQRGERIPSVSGEDNTLNPLDSIAGEISNTAFITSSAEWREAHVHKWFNTFKDKFPAHVRAMTPDKAFFEMGKSEYATYFGDVESLKVARRVHEYISQQMSVLTNEEKMWNGYARQLSESFEKKFDNHFADTVGGVLRQSSDWTKYVRMISFHSYQGMFNLKHLFMQGMNAFNAVVISPVHGTAAAKTSLMYAVALASDNESIWRNVAKANKLSNLGLGMTEDEFVLAVGSLRRTGLLDGIGHNSMWGAEGGKYGVFNKLTRVAGSVSAAPFNAGEGYSRIVSYDIARREYIAANPNKAWWTDDALAEILARQDDLTQNMSTANRSSWQQGWKSIPTQYTQYAIRLLLNLGYSIGGNPRTYNRREGIQLILGHTALLGTAGWGLLPDEWTSDWFKEQDEETKLTILQGFIAGAISHITDGELQLALGKEFGSFNIYKDLFDGMTDPQKTFLEVAGGPGGAAVLKWFGQFGEAIKLYRYGGVSLDTTKEALFELSKGFSSINNATKAYIASKNYNVLQSEQGVDKYKLKDMQLYALSIGLVPNQESDLNTLIKSRKTYNDDLKKLGKEVSELRAKAYTALNSGDVKTYNYYLSAINAVYAAYKDDSVAYEVINRASLETYTDTMLQKLILEDAQKEYAGKHFIVNDNPYKD